MTKIKVGNILFNILAIVTVAAVVFVGFNIVTGTKGYAVTSNSMADKLSKGDVVFSRKVAFEELKAGDIVTVRVGNSGYFTHRIVEVDAGKKTVTTKGDANPSVDPMPSDAENIVGRMVYSIPCLGFLSILFNGGSQTTLIIILILIAAVLIAANAFLAKNKKTRGDNNE